MMVAAGGPDGARTARGGDAAASGLLQDPQAREDMQALREEHRDEMRAWWDKYGEDPSSDAAQKALDELREEHRRRHAQLCSRSTASTPPGGSRRGRQGRLRLRRSMRRLRRPGLRRSGLERRPGHDGRLRGLERQQPLRAGTSRVTHAARCVRTHGRGATFHVKRAPRPAPVRATRRPGLRVRSPGLLPLRHEAIGALRAVRSDGSGQTSDALMPTGSGLPAPVA